jgi:SulP family sulfate permease
LFHTLYELALRLPETNWPTLGIGLFTIIFVLALKKWLKRLPGPLLAVLLSALLVWALGWTEEVRLVGAIPRALPPLSSPFLPYDFWRALLSPALAVAILGIVEAMSIAKSLAGLRSERVDGNREIIAQGLANVSAAFTSGIPGTGSFTRSAVNFQSGAKTRFAGVFSGLAVALVILVAAPLSRFIPMASLAGILAVIAYSMVNKPAIKTAWRATSSDRIVIALTFFFTLVLELEKAVYIGVILSIILFLRKASHPQVYKMAPKEAGGRLFPVEDGAKTCPQITIFQIDGAFFFGAVNEIEEKLHALAAEKHLVVIMRLKGVRLMDATGAHALEHFALACQKKNIRLIITNVKSSVMIVMERIGLDKLIGSENITEDTTAAVSLACAKYIDRARCSACLIREFSECPKL